VGPLILGACLSDPFSFGLITDSILTCLTSASAFNEYFKAYSVAVMNGRERPELAYGGKSKAFVQFSIRLLYECVAERLCLHSVIMPPSALATLSKFRTQSLITLDAN
jgi:hypothetical protein